MVHKCSFIILGEKGNNIKQVNYSCFHLIGILVAIFSLVIVLSYGAFEYVRLNKALAGKTDLEKQITQQSCEIKHQRKQILKFSKEINSLKERIVELNKFEDKIRIVANIERSGKYEELFGIGGSTPEDLNPNIENNKKHTQLIKDMHFQVEQLDLAVHEKKVALSDLLETFEHQKNHLAHTPAIRPAKGWISSNFGYRRSPFTGKREFHKGLDIANKKGTVIVATADGVVSVVEKKGSFGLLLMIDHGFGITTRFAHIDKAVKAPGETVKRGELIAHMGNTGRSTGPHLHYEVRLNGVPVNPSKYIFN